MILNELSFSQNTIISLNRDMYGKVLAMHSNDPLLIHLTKLCIGKIVDECFCDILLDKLSLLDHQVKKTKTTQITLHQFINLKNHKKIALHVMTQPWFDNNNSMVGFITTLYTSTVFSESYLEQYQHQLAIFNHEIKNPLANIIGLCSLLLISKEYTQCKNYIHLINNCATMAVNIIEQLNYINFDDIPIETEIINLEQFLVELDALCRLLLYDKKVSFYLISGNQLPEKIVVDVNKLRQILWNLMNNAIKFTEKGIIKITVKFDYDLNRLLVDVEDTGIGIDASRKQAIFDMYYSYQDNNHLIRGKGIGLALVKSFINKMGGDITVNSEKGKGSCFSFSIITPEIKSKDSDSINQVNNINSLNKPLQFLLIEDEQINCLVTKKIIEKFNCNIDIVNSGYQALKKIKNNQYNYILLDINLPDITGLELIKKIKHEFNFINISSIIILTAYLNDDKSKFFELGIKYIFNKPFSIIHMKKIINNEKVFCENKINISDYINKINIKLLSSYYSDLGITFIEKNIKTFNEVIKTYFLELDKSIASNNNNKLADIAHKIKGAAAAIGLINVVSIASIIESSQLDNEKGKIEKLIIDIKQVCKEDLDYLEHYVKFLKNDPDL